MTASDRRLPRNPGAPMRIEFEGTTDQFATWFSEFSRTRDPSVPVTVLFRCRSLAVPAPSCIVETEQPAPGGDFVPADGESWPAECMHGNTVEEPCAQCQALDLAVPTDGEGKP